MKVIANALNVESSLFDKLICVLELETFVVEETSVKEASVEDKYVELYVEVYIEEIVGPGLQLSILSLNLQSETI